MRLNIILFFALLCPTIFWGQIVVNEQKFDRSKLEFHIFLENQGTETVEIQAIGIASSYVSLDVCNRAEKTVHLSESHMVDFEVDKVETIRNLLRPVVIQAGEEKGILIRANPLPEAICDYWEADITGILGFSNMQKWYSQAVTISEDDYYNFNDWLDQLEQKKGQKFIFEPDRLSRLQLVEWLENPAEDKIVQALNAFNGFFWPSDETKRLLEPLLEDQDSFIQAVAQDARTQQSRKLTRAIQVLKEPDNFLPSQKKKAIQGLGLAKYQPAAPAILDFWRKDNEMEPHLIARTLIQIDDLAMLPELLTMALEFKKTAEEKRGFSHDRWKWLTISALLAHYGYEKAQSLLDDCLRSVLDNYEYPELRLILEALQRSDQDALKKSLTPFYKEAIKVNFSDDFTLAVLPLYMNYVELSNEEKIKILEPYLNSQHIGLQLEAIELTGKHRLQALRPVLEKLLSETDLWEKRYYLAESLRNLRK